MMARGGRRPDGSRRVRRGRARIRAQGRTAGRDRPRIHAVAAGEAIFGPGIARRILGLISAPAANSTPFAALTSREHEVLDLIATGVRNTEIARRMSIAPKTVANHVAAIFTKLQVSDRNQAIILARDAGLGRSNPSPGTENS
jgi:DNA-binding NarL/FixJ family response regulator